MVQLHGFYTVDGRKVICHGTVMPNAEADAWRAFFEHELGLPIWVRIWSASRPATPCFPFNGLDRWGRLGIAEIGVPEFAVLAISSPNSAEEQSRLRWRRATTIGAQSLVQTPSPTASSARASKASTSPVSRRVSKPCGK